MNTQTAARFDMRARIIKALAHPTRLFLVDQLSRGEQCVCDLTERVGADTSTVSKHLSILKAADILQDDKRGTQVFYQLKMPCVLTFLECVDTICQSAARERMELAQGPALGKTAESSGPPAAAR